MRTCFFCSLDGRDIAIIKRNRVTLNVRKEIFVREMSAIGHRIQNIHVLFTELVTFGPGRGHTVPGLPRQFTFYGTGALFSISGQQHSFYVKARVFEREEAFKRTVRLTTLEFDALFDRFVHDINTALNPNLAAP